MSLSCYEYVKLQMHVNILYLQKDGELCLGRAKPEETLVEVRSGPDVQIGRPTWV